MIVSRSLVRFFRRSEGQDLAEYCLVTALIALVALAILWHVSGGASALWSDSNATLGAAATAAANSASGAATTGAASSGGATTTPSGGSGVDSGDHSDR